MIINDKSNKGFYLYSDEVQFEKGDFVVYDGIIYIPKANVMGKNPVDYNELYDIYLGENIADLEGKDFASYIKGAGPDKLVTAYSVGKILNSFITGFDEKGIINNEITADSVTHLRDYFGEETTLLARTNPLDAVMAAPELNNCIFKVDRHIVQDLFGTSQLQFTSSYILLKQYTYMDKEASPTGPAEYIRVQELVDEETGLTKWRYSTSSDNYDSSIDWNSVNANEKVLETIDEIINYYRNKLISFEKEKAAMKSNFRFVEVPFEYDNANGILNVDHKAFPGLYNKTFTGIAENYPITIAVSCSVRESAVREMASLTVNLGRIIQMGIESSETYKLTNTCSLRITYKSSVIELASIGDCRVENIYARGYVESSLSAANSNSIQINLTCYDTEEGQNSSNSLMGHTFLIPLDYSSLGLEENIIRSGTLIFKGRLMYFSDYFNDTGWGGEVQTFQLSIPMSDIFRVPDEATSNSLYIPNSSNGSLSDGNMTWVSMINGGNRFNAMVFISKSHEDSRYDSYLKDDDTEYICIIPTKYNPYEPTDITTAGDYRVIPGGFQIPANASDVNLALERANTERRTMTCEISTDQVYCLLS